MKTTFDQETFSELLQAAIGSRKQKDFASTIGITPAHLSRILNHRFETPPSIETLKRIAANAEGNVTYHDLLIACGYIGTNAPAAEVSLPFNAIPINKFVKATILTALGDLGFTCEVANEPDASPYDLVVRINNADKLQWYFIFLSQKSEDQMRRQFSSNYLTLLFQKMHATDKVSLVTCSRKEYELYTGKLPENLDMNLSIILVDETQLTIDAEYSLARRNGYKNEIDQYRLFK